LSKSTTAGTLLRDRTMTCPLQRDKEVLNTIGNGNDEKIPLFLALKIINESVKPLFFCLKNYV